MAVSKVDAANQIENQLPQANIAGNVNFRNIIINGDMSIAQRGTSATSVTTSRFLLDRFYNRIVSGGGWTITQDTDVPSGQGFSKSLKWECTTANASLSAASEARIWQAIEGQNLQYLKKGTSNAESLTLSFWVKSNKTGTYIVETYDQDNNRDISNSYTINASNTWEKKTISIDGDTTGAFDNDNNASFYINFWLLAGTDYTSGTLQTSWGAYSATDRAAGQVNLADAVGNEFYITGVQLEAGTTASDFEFLPHDVNLKRCERYFQDYTDANMFVMGKAYGTSTSGWRQVFSLKTEMRTTPTVTISSTSNGGSSTDFSISPNTKKFLSFDLTSANGSNTSLFYRWKMTLNSEL